MTCGMDKVILLNKPAGITSFDAVARCRRILHEKKIGHTGTLDPNASGLLIILSGKYTKLLQYCTADHKKYHASFQLGIRTDTEDIWGTVTAEKEYRAHDAGELEEACRKLTGEIMQIPPMYSAIKVNGKKLYELARQGKEIERQPRRITVHALSVHQTGENSYDMEAEVSGGTYIRTLITDYCASLGEYGVMTALERTGIGSVSLGDAVALEYLEAHPEYTADIRSVLNPEIGYVTTDKMNYVRNGRDLELDSSREYVCILDGDDIAAVYRRMENGMYHCERGLF